MNEKASVWSKIKIIIIIVLLFIFSAMIYTIIDSMKNSSSFENFLTIIELAATVICVYIFYTPLKRIFRPHNLGDKFLCFITALVLFSFEFVGISNIIEAVFSNKGSIPKYWYIYVLGLVLLVMFYLKYRKPKYKLSQLDKMDGHEFEYACADILEANKYKKVKVTRGSGDFGVDILAEKDGKKYAVQCKCYSNTLGNKPIQEVIGGLAYYGCSRGAVMTNQYFSKAAKELAMVNGVELWDRDVLEKMLQRTKMEKPSETNSDVQISAETEQENIEETEQLIVSDTQVGEDRLELDENETEITTSDEISSYSKYDNTIFYTDKLIPDVLDFLSENTYIIRATIQRKFQLGSDHANNIIHELISLGFLSENIKLKGHKVLFTHEDLPKIHEKLCLNENPNHHKYLAGEQKLNQIEQIAINNLIDSYQEQGEEYLVRVTTNTVNYLLFCGVNTEFKNLDIRFDTNEVVLELSLQKGVRTSQFKQCLGGLKDHLQVKYAEYVYPTSTPYTVGIKIPLPDYLKRGSDMIAAYQKNKEIERELEELNSQIDEISNTLDKIKNDT